VWDIGKQQAVDSDGHSHPNAVYISAIETETKSHSNSDQGPYLFCVVKGKCNKMKFFIYSIYLSPKYKICMLFSSIHPETGPVLMSGRWTKFNDT
jgi:hypothetical protein